MNKLMERLYDDLDEAKAFEISFTNFVYFYDDVGPSDFVIRPCEKCRREVQIRDYLAPKASCKKDTGILHSFECGVSPGLRDELIANFDVTEDDFRPVRTKKGEIVYYQITPQHVMKPINEVNNWLPKEPCPQCGWVQYQHSEHEFRNAKKEEYFYITQEALDDLHDFNVTYERFVWGRPMCIISRRVYDFLTERYPRTHYKPFCGRDGLRGNHWPSYGSRFRAGDSGQHSDCPDGLYDQPAVPDRRDARGNRDHARPQAGPERWCLRPSWLCCP